MLVLGRLVPHKRVEMAIETLARLRPEFPDLTLTIAGRGWWEDPLREVADRLGRGRRDLLRRATCPRRNVTACTARAGCR